MTLRNTQPESPGRVQNLVIRERFDQDLEFDFLLRSLRDLRRLAVKLAAAPDRRAIPQILLDAVVGTFEPEQAMILIRRQPALCEPERTRQVVVARILAASAGLRSGIHVELDDDEIRGLPPGGAWGRLGCDLLFPMMRNDECEGAIAVQIGADAPAGFREVLELVAEFGAFALSQASQINQIRSMADLDSLTGILNKGVVTAQLDELLATAKERGEPLAILLFDLDHFKTYNDVNGHLAGDRLLRLLARVIGEHTRREDTFGRFGGDEFLLVFPGRSVPGAVGAGRSIRQVLEDFDFPFGENQPLGRITVSGGVSACEPGACSGTDLLLAADKALYLAKTAGRDRIVPTPILRRQTPETRSA